MGFEFTYIPERNLIFGGKNEEQDPRIGLSHFGPYHYSKESSNQDKIKLGVIGDKTCIEKARKIIELIKKPIDSEEPNKWLYPPFPGLFPADASSTKFLCIIETSTTWEQLIQISEIDKIIRIIDTNERIGFAVKLYLEKLRNILDEDNIPDVVLCCLPDQIEEYCGISDRTRGAKIPKPTKLQLQVEELKSKKQSFLAQWGFSPVSEEEVKPVGYDFRSALKGKLMGLKSPQPIQLLRESTADAILNYEKGKKTSKQIPAQFAWNFSTALYYKANGKPWRLAKLRDDTCYIGISFYKDKLSFNKDIQTSMAQVFTHTGEGFVLRGTEVNVDEATHEAHLSKKQSYELLADIIKRYTEKAKRNPIRIVIHKGTLFSDDEKTGFGKAIGDLQRDFVTISKRNKDIQFLRDGGQYPVLRGTLVSLTKSEYLFYTSGYIPRIRTYPGHKVPQPLFINHFGDSEIRDICDDILGLTKLNWNTTSFSTEMPITLEFAGRVGKVLSELEKGSPIQNHYKFYM